MVLLTKELFSDSSNTMALDVIAMHAMHEKHRVLVEDDRDECFLEWLRALAPAHQDTWDVIIRRGYQLEAREPARRSIMVVSASTQWTNTPPVLSIQEAVIFLNRPFHILLEDAVSDREFLLRMALPEQQEFFIDQQLNGHIIFENGGGLSVSLRRGPWMLRRRPTMPESEWHDVADA